MPPKRKITKPRKHDSDTSSEEETQTEIQLEEQTDNVEYHKYPLCFDIHKPTGKSIFLTDGDVSFSTSIDFPRFEYGFHHFIHQGKKYFGDAVKSLEGKKPVWRVLNKYEIKVDNYNESISDISVDYFDMKKKPEIMSRAFYKLWEILMLYDLIDLKDSKFISAHLAEGPGSFIQATIMYRDMFCKNGLTKNDKYYGVTLHPEGKTYVPEMDKKFTEYYEKESPKRLFLHKTYTKQEAGGDSEKDNGDITDPKTMRMFGGEINTKCDFITADGGFENENENLQEQESFRLIISEIVNAIRLQKKGGNFVCKFFETFTNTSMKLISLLTELYETVNFVKPLMSRISNSEKYAVCMNFKYTDTNKEYKDIIKKLENIHSTMHKSKDFVVGLFNKYIVPSNLLRNVTSMNILMSNLQLKSINIIVSFIRKQIYSGEEYHNGHDAQIEGTKYWLDVYFTDDRKKCKQLKDDILEITKKHEMELLKVIV